MRPPATGNLARIGNVVVSLQREAVQTAHRPDALSAFENLNPFLIASRARQHDVDKRVWRHPG